MDSQTLRGSVRPALSLLVAYAVLLTAIFPTALGIAQRWVKLDESYSHGFLLLAVSLGLIIQSWRRLPPTLGFYPLWLVPFLAALLGYALGAMLRIQALQQLVLVPLLLGLLAVFLGWHQVRRFIIPVGILFFAIPVWDFISWPLQLITVEVNRLLLGLFGIEFRVDGVFVYLLGVGAFEIAHGCSGLRYLLVGQLLAVLYGYLNLHRVASRLVLYGLAVGFALLANWIRVFVIIYMGYETNMQSSLISDHDTFGWWVFAGTLVPLFLLARWLENSRFEKAHRRMEQASEKKPRDNGQPVYALISTALIMGLMTLSLPGAGGSVTDQAVQYSMKIDRERYSPMFQASLEGWQPSVKHPDRIYEQAFFNHQEVRAGGQPSEKIFVGVYSYDYQRPRAEVIQYSNRLYDNSEWLLDRFFDIETLDDKAFKGAELRHRVTDTSIYLAFGYYVEGFWETDELQAKLAQIKGAFNRRTDGSMMVFALSCDDCAGEAAVADLARQLSPEVARVIDQTQTAN
ncbi:MAG: exosortase/archaeosortase family protein [Marinobacter sp.]|uniref:exosortase/archaeosortase family protein n=1 Tax=Marinobacter sp. TaxID=50741 RepID=UPI00299E3943|nr:exosortase/archaeosortase family protein [Marinobacter sp.]MDX1634506.1 exosortase/archaeosortase family protein [Marinobacter sp.]